MIERDPPLPSCVHLQRNHLLSFMIAPIPSVVLLGAGLSGLSAALTLQEAGVSFRFLERETQPGGHAITLEDSGFRFDRTGHLLHLRHEHIRSRVQQWLGPALLPIQRRSLVYSHGVFTRYPFQANTFGLPPPIAYECVMGFLQARSQAPENIQSFEDFCLAHFGEGISRHFMIPYNAKLYGVHPRELTAAWCQRFVPLPKLEDVIAGAVGLNDRELGYNADFLYPRQGIGMLPDAMAMRLPQLELGRPALAIDLERKILDLGDEQLPFKVLLTSLPLSQLGSLCKGLPTEVQDAFTRLRCAELWYLDLALESPPKVPFHWVYVPEERFPFYRVGCYTAFSDALSPPGMSSLYVELATRPAPALEEILPQVLASLTEMKILESPKQLRFARLRHLKNAYVIHDFQHEKAVRLVQSYLTSQRVMSFGRYGAWNYSAMEDALLFGEQAAHQVLSWLAS